MRKVAMNTFWPVRRTCTKQVVVAMAALVRDFFWDSVPVAMTWWVGGRSAGLLCEAPCQYLQNRYLWANFPVGRRGNYNIPSRCCAV